MAGLQVDEGDTVTFRMEESDNPHPAPFPVALAARCIQSLRPGPGLILDPFLGSGTTAMAAGRAGVEWMGIERSAEYVRLANERLREVAEQLL